MLSYQGFGSKGRFDQHIRASQPNPVFGEPGKIRFEKVWIEILPWLQNEPEATAKQLFQRLQIQHPGVFNGQLRTLQRRIKDWRAVMAKQLVFGALRDDDGSAEITPIGMMSQEQMDTDSLTYPVSDDLQIQIHVIHGLRDLEKRRKIEGEMLTVWTDKKTTAKQDLSHSHSW